MTDATPTAQDIARFLQDNPAFFEEHADWFASLRVPSPHGEQTISLTERQILILRERIRELEWRISELVHNATAGETFFRNLTRWCERVASEPDPQLLPGVIALGLAEQFKIDHVALRLWNLPGLDEDSGYEDASDDVRAFADSLQTPYCGADTEFEAASWLNAKPRSLALVTLRRAEGEAAVGLLVLGSDDPDRFNPEMGTDFLVTLSRLASAALQRLAGPNPC
jgi:uncharacterized protein YigA (DUF484 family)